MIRAYEPRDTDQCIRILREVGWVEGKDTDKVSFESYISETKTLVEELHGEVEVFAATRPGSIRYLDCDLPFSGVTGVATSRIERQQGIASETTTLAIANSAIDGAALSILGIFD